MDTANGKPFMELQRTRIARKAGMLHAWSRGRRPVSSLKQWIELISFAGSPPKSLNGQISSMSKPALRLPSIFSELPVTPILLPHSSPIQECKSLTHSVITSSPSPFLSRHPSHQPPSTYSTLNLPAIWVYREDLNSLIAPAGNKLRKLAHVLPHALRNPRLRTLITTGGVQSNCCRLTAAVAAKFGLKCIVLLVKDAEDVGELGRRRGRQQTVHDYERTGNVQLARLLGAEVRFVDGVGAAGSVDAVDELRKLAAKVGIEDDGTNFFIPQGASESPSGGVGYARWVFEMLEQESRLRCQGVLAESGCFDNVVVACATGGTLAGMIAGMKLAEKHGWADGGRRKIIGIETFAGDLEERRKVVLRVARDTAEILGLEREVIQPKDVMLDGRWTAGGYGVYDDRTKAAIQLAARTESLLLDPVYTGKAMAAVVGGVLQAELPVNTLFVHTGGHIVLPAYLGIEGN
jgi:1-aminocyclopropane-1-carboxylate deaminase